MYLLKIFMLWWVVTGSVAQAKTYYEILELTIEASQEDIAKAKKRLLLKYHPDRNMGVSPAEAKALEDRAKDITEAASILSDPDKRKAYDDRIAGRNSFPNEEVIYPKTEADPFSHQDLHETWSQIKSKHQAEALSWAEKFQNADTDTLWKTIRKSKQSAVAAGAILALGKQTGDPKALKFLYKAAVMNLESPGAGNILTTFALVELGKRRNEAGAMDYLTKIARRGFVQYFPRGGYHADYYFGYRAMVQEILSLPGTTPAIRSKALYEIVKIPYFTIADAFCEGCNHKAENAIRKWAFYSLLGSINEPDSMVFLTKLLSSDEWTMSDVLKVLEIKNTREIVSRYPAEGSRQVLEELLKYQSKWPKQVIPVAAQLIENLGTPPVEKASEDLLRRIVMTPWGNPALKAVAQDSMIRGGLARESVSAFGCLKHRLHQAFGD